MDMTEAPGPPYVASGATASVCAWKRGILIP